MRRYKKRARGSPRNMFVQKEMKSCSLGTYFTDANTGDNFRPTVAAVEVVVVAAVNEMLHRHFLSQCSSVLGLGR